MNDKNSDLLQTEQNNKNYVVKGVNLYKNYNIRNRTIPVIKGINIKINRGDFVIIFGPSGCGKTTLINLLLGLEQPTLGTVGFLDKDLSSMDADQRAVFRKQNVGIVYQQPNWIKSLSVVENVAFPLLLIGKEESDSNEEALMILDKLNMNLWKFYNPTELSSGQQQKVALSRALITNPDVIFADEPTGNLDYKSGEMLMKLFTELNKSGKTIVIITHNLGHLSFAKRVFQMFDGKILNKFEVTTKNVYSLQQKLLTPPVENKNDGRTGYDTVPKSLEKKKRNFKEIFISKPLAFLKSIKFHLFNVFQFIPLFIVYLVEKTFEYIGRIIPGVSRISKKISNGWNNLFDKLHKISNYKNNSSIHKESLFNISLKNLYIKGSRSFITIGGMAVGIGFIVLLVSVGYGVERLVISRIGNLDRKKQIETMPAVSSNIVLNEETLTDFRNMTGVTNILPLISIAGKVNYNNSITDVVAYGVDSEYLEKSDIRLIEGAIFSMDSLSKNNLVGKAFAAEEENSITGNAVLNLALIRIFGIDSSSIVGNYIELEFPEIINKDETEISEIITTNNQSEINDVLESNNIKINYLVTGVIDEGENPIIYIELDNLLKCGYNEYSQVKIIADNLEDINGIRQHVEASGFTTISILDTINQVENLFKNLRIGLGIVGVVALTIASLGMFNTLTVSLLERTREIGLMKAIGMQSKEVYNLFQIESMIMGILGGILGIFFGFIIGKLISLILSVISIASGEGLIDVTYIPVNFALVVIFMSIGVGVITGYYPAKRATKISPLDAIRYE